MFLFIKQKNFERLAIQIILRRWILMTGTAMKLT